MKKTAYHVLLRDRSHAFDVDVDDHLGRVPCGVSDRKMKLSTEIYLEEQ